MSRIASRAIFSCRGRCRGGGQIARGRVRGCVRVNDWGLIRLIDARAGDFQAGRFYVEFEHDVETVRYRESEEDGSDELGK